MRTRIFRVLVCMAVAFALLVNISPIRAEASAGTLLGAIAGVTSVNVPAGLVYGAAAIALGVAAGANDDFRNMVDSAVTAGTEWVKDGTVELLRVVDAAGNAAYFAASSFMESVRQWLFDSKTVESVPLSYEFTFTFSGNTYTAKADVPFAIAVFKDTYWGSAFVTCFGSEFGTVQVLDAAGKIIKTESFTGNSFRYCNILSCSVNSISTSLHVYDYWHSGTKFPSLSPSSPFDVQIESVPTVPIDGSSALDWAPEYQANRLYVTGGNNDPDPPDENNGKWFWPLALTLTAADLYLMSQADEWSGETPQEFNDYTQNTEFEILDRPEFDGYQGIEIAPVTNPNPNPDPGTDPDPTAPGEPNPDPDPDPDPDPVPDPSTDPGEDPDSNPDAGGNGSQNPEDPPSVSDYTLDLKDFFPFCIPYDIYDLVQVLDAEPEAPHFVFDVDFPYMEEPWHIDIDFASWDPVALVLRRLELLLFIVGLAMATRNYYIRG